VELSLAELAGRIGATLRGDGARKVTGCAELGSAGAAHVAFYANKKYKRDLAATRAAAVIVSDDDAALVPQGACALVAAQPYVAFAKASTLFHLALRKAPGRHGIVHGEAHPTAHVAEGAYVGPGARIGARTVLHPGVTVLDGAQIGDDCLLWPGVVVREGCVVGNRVILQPNVVIGSDGFGFAFDLEGDGEGPIHRKVPQAGIVRIEDDVEIGACSCVDRATLGETVIGRGVKIDNLVQVAHNVTVGPLALLVAQVGIGGSTEIGAGAILAGQVGVVGHVRVGDGARIGAQSGVINDVGDGETVAGYPSMPHALWLRAMAATRQLPELLKDLRRLQSRVEELERKLAET
jgi:UDP-3-O-[3-hydroxymyristoyl] glucosamine N-acyltransferase